MKPMQTLVFRRLGLTVLLTVSLPALCLDSPTSPPATGDRPAPNLPQQISALRAQLDHVLQAISIDYAELLDKEDKTFEDFQALASLRNELLGISHEAKSLVDQMTVLRDQLGAERPQRVERPELGEVEQGVLARHTALMQALGKDLETILNEMSPDYATLTEKEDKTLDDIKAMQDLRRQLLVESAAAQAKLAEMQEMASQFRSDHPEIFVGVPKAVEGIGQRARAMQTLREAIDEIVAEESPRYAELLGKPEKTPDEVGEMLRLRRELISASEAAQQLQNAARVMQERVAGSIRRLRENRHEIGGGEAGE